MSASHLTRKTKSNQFSPFRSQSNTPVAYGPDDIRYYIDGYVLHHKSQRHSERTIASCIDRMAKFVWFLDKHGYSTELPAITPNHIRHYLTYLSEEKEGRWDSSSPRANLPLSQNSIHTYAKTLKAFCRWATKEAGAGLARNPFDNVQMPSLPNQWHVQVYTENEITTLFEAVEGMGPPFIVHRNRAMLAILLDSGLRASELLSLEAGDINPQEGVFAVTGKGRKTRTVVIGSFARRQLWAYLSQHRLRMNTPETALFLSLNGTPLTYSGLRAMFRLLKNLSGIERVSVRAHNCRHTAATIMHRNGMRGATLQEVLGHSNFDTTRKYYLSISPEDLRKEHDMYGPLDGMSKELNRGNGRPLTPGSDTRSQAWQPSTLPSADVLAREVARSSYRAVARRYGVSDTAIRKRLRKAGLI